MTELLDELGTVAASRRVAGSPRSARSTRSSWSRRTTSASAVTGSGEQIETEVDAVGRALHSLALAAVRYGPVDAVSWSVRGRELELSPVTEAAAPVAHGRRGARSRGHSSRAW